MRCGRKEEREEERMKKKEKEKKKRGRERRIKTEKAAQEVCRPLRTHKGDNMTPIKGRLGKHTTPTSRSLTKLNQNLQVDPR